jgi:transposase
VARQQGLRAVPAKTTAEYLKLFRHGVAAGLSQVRRVPVAKSKQPPARLLLECLRHREADVLRFLSDTAIPPTSNQAERDLRPSKTQQKISGRPRSKKTTRDRYAIRGYASPPPSSGSPSSPPSATPSPETPGCHPSRPAPEPPPEPVTDSNSGITKPRCQT